MKNLIQTLQGIGLVTALGISCFFYYAREVSPSPVDAKKVMPARPDAPFLSIDETPLATLRKAEPLKPIGSYTADQVGKAKLFEMPRKELFPQ